MKNLLLILVIMLTATLGNAQSSTGLAPMRMNGSNSANDEVRPLEIKHTRGVTYVYGDVYVNNNDYIGRFEASNPSNLNLLLPYTGKNFSNAGEMVAGSETQMYFIDHYNKYVYLFNAATNTASNLGVLSGVSGENVLGMALDYNSGDYYICDELNNLYTVDMNTLVALKVGNFGTSGFMIGITCDGSGNLWGFDIITDSFYSIDKNTGHATLVGPIGFDANFAQGLGYDSNADMVVMTSYNITSGGKGEYRSVNVSTGATTLLGDIGNGNTVEVSTCIIPYKSSSVPISSWAILFGVILMGAFLIIRFRQRLA
jgi:hypothetical protein